MQRTADSTAIESDHRRGGGMARFVVVASLAVAALALTRAHSYLLFHSMVELFSIAIAAGIFMMGWNTRRFHSNDYLLFIGVGFLYVGMLDLLHTLAYRGMGVFVDRDSDLPTQLWMGARFMESGVLLVAPLLLGRRLNAWPLLGALGLVFCGLVVSTVVWPVFPACYIEGRGLTWFKVIGEYVVCVALLAAIALLWAKRERLDRTVWALLTGALAMTVAQELAFTLYTDPYGPWNLIGHVLKVVALYLIYKAIVETGLTRPYAILLRDLKEREASLRAAKVAAESASAAKSEFLAVLSHELRTPLAPVLMTASLLDRRGDLPEEVRADVQTIRRNVELEARIIDDLLDLTRISRGKLKFEMRPTDLHALIRDAVSICSHGEGAAIEMDLKAGLNTVHGDTARLQQVFWNLLSNARKFTPPSGAIRISTADLPDGRVQVEVSDSGAGIEPEFLPRIFAAFEQARAGQFGGLGLGLAISKAIVEAHGGSIRAHSDGAGRGATFIVELAARAEPAPAPAPSPAPSAVNGRLAILLVEDHPSTLKALGRLIGGLGHEVHAAGTIAEARCAAEQRQFDLVISDLGLPDGSGHDLMRWLKERGKVRGIALSGYGMDSDLRMSREAGFDEHLVKPVDLQKLEAAIARTVGRSAVQ